MFGVGVIEGFFGPEWSWQARHHFCEALPAYGGEFFLYAPKRDSFLRKNWMQSHPIEVSNELKKLSVRCQQSKIAFGVGLSPFEIHADWSLQTKSCLRNKIHQLEDLNISYLGLFFDDMKGAPDLADKQIEIVEYVKSATSKNILFCPTYYSTDPILDKVFGQRALDYGEKIGTLPKDIQILWTGSKVIPKSILSSELDEVARVLKRKPFIWDNYFANDGPKQCKFLKMRPLEGRTQSALQSASGWAFNLMNQARLSEIVFAASASVLKNSADPGVAFQQAVEKFSHLNPELMKRYGKTLLEVGFDGMDSSVKKEVISLLGSDEASQEIREWLDGKYLVGAECLTD